MALNIALNIACVHRNLLLQANKVHKCLTGADCVAKTVLPGTNVDFVSYSAYVSLSVPSLP